MPEEARTPSANFTFYLAFEMRRVHNAHFYSRSYYNFDFSEFLMWGGAACIPLCTLTVSLHMSGIRMTKDDCVMTVCEGKFRSE